MKSLERLGIICCGLALVLLIQGCGDYQPPSIGRPPPPPEDPSPYRPPPPPPEDPASPLAEQMRPIAAAMAQQGYSLVGDTGGVGILASRQSRRHVVELEGGVSYRLAGVCLECRDIDLILYDENGNKIDEDVEVDATPLVAVQPRQTGSFTVEVRMHDCPQAECHYFFNAFRRTAEHRNGPRDSHTGQAPEDPSPYRPPPPPPEDPASLLAEQIAPIVAAMAEQGYSVDRGDTGVVTGGVGELASRQSRRHVVELEGGVSYRLAGVCLECRDIDLVVYDENDNRIDADMEVDATPLVAVQPRWTGSFTVEVRMYECAQPECHYLFAAYRRTGRISGVSEPDHPSPDDHLPEDAEREIVGQLAGGALAFSEDGYQLDPDSFESMRLPNGSEASHQISLPTGFSHIMLGACSGCDDLDMFLRDANGDLVDSDELADAVPITRVDDGGVFTLIVRMYSCPADSCHYGFAVYSKPNRRQSV